MEVIVGHLGRLEFMTSGGTAFNRIGELVRLARVILNRACNNQPMGLSANLSRDENLASTTVVMHNRSPNKRSRSTTETLYDTQNTNGETMDVSNPLRRKNPHAYQSV